MGWKLNALESPSSRKFSLVMGWRSVGLKTRLFGKPDDSNVDFSDGGMGI